MRQTQEQMRRSSCVGQCRVIDCITDGVGVDTYLAHQLSLLRWLPFESWIVAMFPFILLNGGVVRFIAEGLESRIVL